MTKQRVAVLYGGKADEHSISCISAASVLQSIDTNHFEPIPIAITKQGSWIIPRIDPCTYSLNNEHLPVIDDSDNDTHVILDISRGKQGFFTKNTDGVVESLGNIDVVFPVLHGPFGEDGTIQGLLDMMNVPYVGCGVFASATCMDKHYCKVVLRDKGLRVAPWITVNIETNEDITEEYCIRIEKSIAQAQLASPLFVKPSRAGSSFGVMRVDAEQGTRSFRKQLATAIRQARKHDTRILIEQGIDGREIECAVLQTVSPETDNGQLQTERLEIQASLPGEIVLMHKNDQHGEFYDFDTKYCDSTASRVQIPARGSDELLQKVRQTAMRAFRAVDGRGLSRVDSFVTADGEIIVNEINTMPGFTAISLYAKAWEYMGVSYQDLVTRLIETACYNK